MSPIRVHPFSHLVIIVNLICSYVDIFLLFFYSTVAGSIDGVLGVGEEETRKMILVRETTVAAGDAPEPTIPSFLMHSRNAEKTPRMEQASTPFMAFHLDCGICESDTIPGSSELSMEWSRHSITPTNHATFISSGGIDEVEILGANGLCIVSFTYLFHMYSPLYITYLYFQDGEIISDELFAFFRLISTFRPKPLVLGIGMLLQRGIVWRRSALRLSSVDGKLVTM